MNSETKQYGLGWLKFYLNWRFPLAFIFGALSLISEFSQAKTGGYLTAGFLSLFAVDVAVYLFRILVYGEMKKMTEKGYRLNNVLLLVETFYLPLAHIFDSDVVSPYVMYLFLAAISALLWFWPNYTYFKHRKNLFTGEHTLKEIEQLRKLQDVPSNPSAQAANREEKKFVCTNCGSYSSGWYQTCPSCGASGKMERALVSAPAVQPQRNLPETKVTTSAEVDYCPYCGAELVGDYRFCPDCGTEIVKKNKAQPANAGSIQNKGSVPVPAVEESAGYYFENAVEFALYVKYFANGKGVQWLKGDKYLVAQRKGYDLVEQRQFQKAIEALKQSLELNPVGIGARFEMCEAYIQMNNLSLAKSTLLDMKDFMIEDKNIARFYRRMGFIEIESRNYPVAAACYQYSKQFENHSSIPNELAYIRQAAGRNVETSNPGKVLSNAGIPLLTTSNIS